jgi:hypothetical protein
VEVACRTPRTDGDVGLGEENWLTAPWSLTPDQSCGGRKPLHTTLLLATAHSSNSSSGAAPPVFSKVDPIRRPCLTSYRQISPLRLELTKFRNPDAVSGSISTDQSCPKRPGREQCQCERAKGRLIGDAPDVTQLRKDASCGDHRDADDLGEKGARGLNQRLDLPPDHLRRRLEL